MERGVGERRRLSFPLRAACVLVLTFLTNEILLGAAMRSPVYMGVRAAVIPFMALVTLLIGAISVGRPERSEVWAGAIAIAVSIGVWSFQWFFPWSLLAW